jgi:hypothetical protein
MANVCKFLVRLIPPNNQYKIIGATWFFLKKNLQSALKNADTTTTAVDLASSSMLL